MEIDNTDLLLKQLEAAEEEENAKNTILSKNVTKPKTALQLAKQVQAATTAANKKKKKQNKIEKPKTIQEEDEDIDYGDGNQEQEEIFEDSVSMELQAATNLTTKEGQSKTTVRGMDISSIDFIAASANDMNNIQETTALNEDNLLSTIKLYKKNHINHVKILYRFADDPTKPCGKELNKETYPLTSDKKCLYCHKVIGDGPIFIPHTFDPKRNVIILTRDACCSRNWKEGTCAKLLIRMRNKSNMSQQLSLLGRLLRLLGFPISGATGVPLSARKDFSYYGYLTEEEWESKQTNVNITVKEVPALFVETYLEETDIKEREEEKRKIFNRLHSIRATPVQQQNYKENIERVVKEQNKVKEVEQQSPLAKKIMNTSKK